MIPDHLIAWPPPGRYLLAISGGADSMALLHLLSRAAANHGYDLIVAHFDHGLHPGSAAAAGLVQQAAAPAGWPFVQHAAHLGRASEAAARAARWAWLEQTRRAEGAAAVITAHHADDLLETSLLNLARGAGRHGLAPMQSGPILRPLLGVTRTQLRSYAQRHHLSWHEDPTNADTTNPRNFLRHQLLAQATPAWQAAYRAHISQLATLNTAIDHTLAGLLATHRTNLGYAFPHPLVRDLSLIELEELIIAAAHQLRPGLELDRRLIQELALFAKTTSPHRRRPLRDGLYLARDREAVTLETA